MCMRTLVVLLTLSDYGFSADSPGQLYELYKGKKALSGSLVETVYVGDKRYPLQTCAFISTINNESRIASFDNVSLYCSLWNFNSTYLFKSTDETTSTLLVKLKCKGFNLISEIFVNKWWNNLLPSIAKYTEGKICFIKHHTPQADDWLWSKLQVLRNYLFNRYWWFT